MSFCFRTEPISALHRARGLSLGNLTDFLSTADYAGSAEFDTIRAIRDAAKFEVLKWA